MWCRVEREVNAVERADERGRYITVCSVMNNNEPPSMRLADVPESHVNE